MAITFPTSPSNGQQIVAGDKTYTYSSVSGTWNITGSTDPLNVLYTRTELVATADQTTFNVNYSTDYPVEVFVNGLQYLSTDYTATNGTTVVLDTGLPAGAEVVINYATATGGTNLSAVSQSIIPDTNEAYDLGSADNKFRDLYLSGSSIILGNTTLSAADGVLQVSTGGEPAAPVAGGVQVYDTVDLLPTTADAGSQAYVVATNRLYIWNGNGWFSVALLNNTPTISEAQASYSLAADGTPTVVNLTAEDPEGLPITWTHVSADVGSIATITNDGNGQFTITPSVNEVDAGTFTVTFRASDGVNIASTQADIVLSFANSGIGGTLVENGTTNVHVFSADATFEITSTRPAGMTIDIASYAGGGGGGVDNFSSNRGAGGGGGGGYHTLSSLTVSNGDSFNVYVGEGGSGGDWTATNNEAWIGGGANGKSSLVVKTNELVDYQKFTDENHGFVVSTGGTAPSNISLYRNMLHIAGTQGRGSGVQKQYTLESNTTYFAYFCMRRAMTGVSGSNAIGVSAYGVNEASEIASDVTDSVGFMSDGLAHHKMLEFNTGNNTDVLLRIFEYDTGTGSTTRGTIDIDEVLVVKGSIPSSLDGTHGVVSHAAGGGGGNGHLQSGVELGANGGFVGNIGASSGGGSNGSPVQTPLSLNYITGQGNSSGPGSGSPYNGGGGGGITGAASGTNGGPPGTNNWQGTGTLSIGAGGGARGGGGGFPGGTNAGSGDSPTGKDAAAGLGGGGGAMRYTKAGNGGSGVVFIRYSTT